MSNEGYDIYTGFWNKLSASTPGTTGVLEMLAPMLQNTGMDITPWLNILRYNRQDRPFYEMDSYQATQMVRNFREQTAGPPKETLLASLGNNLAAYFIDNKGLAESAVRYAAGATGAGTYAFGSGGLSMADTMPGWNVRSMGRSAEALTDYMADIYRSEAPESISRGERQMIAARMVGENPDILRDYGRMRRIGLETGLNQKPNETLEDYAGRLRGMRERGELDPNDKAQQQLVKLAETMERVNRQTDQFGEAMGTWGRILKTDAVTAMRKVDTMLGGSFAAQFSGNEQALQEMAWTMQHTGAVTGRGMNHMRAVADQARQYMIQSGGPAEAAMNVADTAMTQAMGGRRYHLTQEELDKNYTRYNADLWSTDAGRIAAGGWQYFVEQRMRSLRPGQIFDQRAATQEYNAILQSMGGSVTVQNMNRALSRATGTNATMQIGDYGNLSDLTYAMDWRSDPNNRFSTISRQQGQRELVNQIAAHAGWRNDDGSLATYDSIYRASNAILGRDRDIFELVQMNPHDLSQLGLDQRQMAYVQNFNRNWQVGVRSMQVNHAGDMGAMANASAMGVANFVSSTSIRREQAVQRQRDMRVRLSSIMPNGGMFRSMVNYLRNNPSATVGEILSAAGTKDLDGKALDALAAIDVSPEDRRELMSTFSKLGDNVLSSKEDRAFFRDRIDKFRESVARGDQLFDSAKYLSSIGIGYDAETNRLTVGEFDRGIFARQRNEWRGKEIDRGKERSHILEWEDRDGQNGLSFSEKKAAAERMAVHETIRQHLAKKGPDGPRDNGDYSNMLFAAEAGYRDEYEYLYKSVKNTVMKSKDYAANLEKAEKEMGVAYDDQNVASVISNILYAFGQKLGSVLASDGSVNVRIKGEQ